MPYGSGRHVNYQQQDENAEVFWIGGGGAGGGVITHTKGTYLRSGKERRVGRKPCERERLPRLAPEIRRRSHEAASVREPNNS